MREGKRYVIIVAGGKGLRMGGDIPKQYLEVGGKPILMRTIERFYHFDPSIRIILVLPPRQQSYWKRLCEQYGFDVHHWLAKGGETRFHSVRNGLALVPDNGGDDDVVAVHDGVRPFVAESVLEECFNKAREHGAAVPVIPVVESIRHLKGNMADSEAVLRSEYRFVQTPQCFSRKFLKRAYAQNYSEDFTDDASVVENMGLHVVLVEGNRENIKITTPLDLKLAELLMAEEK